MNAAPPTPPGRFDAQLRRGECLVAVLISLVAGLLHWRFWQSAGTLWRDEAAGVQLATLPNFGETWRMLAHDSFPILFPGLVRGWSAAGLGSDANLRLLGFGIGLGILGAVWLSARWMGMRAPLVALGLLAANATLIRWGDSLRAYGCGSLFIILMPALIWLLVQGPTLKRFMAASFFAVLAVQTLYQNLFLLGAACLAGMLVCARERRWQHASIIGLVGLVAGASLMPYLPLVKASQSWWLLEKIEARADFFDTFIWPRLFDAMSPAGPLAGWLWIGLMLLATGVGFAALQRGGKPSADAAGSLPGFAAMALVFGALGFFVFLRMASLPTQVWYYLPLMAYAAVCGDAALANLAGRRRLYPVLLAVVAMALPLPGSWRSVSLRMTNVNDIIQELNARAGVGDLIIVHPWYCGISFSRYYRGKIPWTTLPELADRRFHRYDLFKVKMQEEHPIQPTLERLQATLQSGNTVWFVGWIPLDSSPPPEIRPAPNNPWGWADEAYSELWGARVGYEVVTHAQRVEAVTAQDRDRVSPFENLPLVMVTGWRE